MSNKNLKLLTGQNDIMSGVYTDEKQNKNIDPENDPYNIARDAKHLQSIRRTNNVLQNQQINRAERELEKASK